jgi:hypothetical protein
MLVRNVLVRYLPIVLATLSAAGARARADDEVHISVVAVLATDKNDRVDKRVECVASYMKKANPKLTGFSLARMTCKDVRIGAKDCFDVVDGQKVCVTAEKRCEKDSSRVCLKVEAPTLGAITYQTCCNKFFPIVTRYQTKDGETLIIAVRVKSCKDD